MLDLQTVPRCRVSRWGTRICLSCGQFQFHAPGWNLWDVLAQRRFYGQTTGDRASHSTAL